MKSYVSSSIFLLAAVNLISPSNAQESNPQSCKPTVIKTPTNPLPRDRFVQELNVQCGSPSNSQTVSQSGSKADVLASDSKESWSLLPSLLEALAKVISSIAWPLAAGVIAFSFKKELATLLGRLKWVKAAGAEAAFAENVRAAEAEGVLPRADDPAPVSPDIFEDASKNPRGTVLAAWFQVESLIRRIYTAMDLFSYATVNNPKAIPALRMIRELEKAEVLDRNTAKMVDDLRRMRNDAAHLDDFNPDPDAVIRYVQLAQDVMSFLKSKLPSNNPSQQAVE